MITELNITSLGVVSVRDDGVYRKDLHGDYDLVINDILYAITNGWVGDFRCFIVVYCTKHQKIQVCETSFQKWLSYGSSEIVQRSIRNRRRRWKRAEWMNTGQGHEHSHLN